MSTAARSTPAVRQSPRRFPNADAMKVFTGFARVADILVAEGEPAMMLEARTVQSRMPKQGRQMPK